tara:strand:- start:689 stop:946 length:258 start_codon:yes stop_codon:yes gene_type:complete
MILLVEGNGKTHLCRELHKAIGKQNCFSFNDGVTLPNIAQVISNRSKIPYPVVIITGDSAALDYAQRILSGPEFQEPVVRMELKG